MSDVPESIAAEILVDVWGNLSSNDRLGITKSQPNLPVADLDSIVRQTITDKSVHEVSQTTLIQEMIAWLGREIDRFTLKVQPSLDYHKYLIHPAPADRETLENLVLHLKEIDALDEDSAQELLDQLPQV